MLRAVRFTLLVNHVPELATGMRHACNRQTADSRQDPVAVIQTTTVIRKLPEGRFTLLGQSRRWRLEHAASARDSLLDVGQEISSNGGFLGDQAARHGPLFRWFWSAEGPTRRTGYTPASSSWRLMPGSGNPDPAEFIESQTFSNRPTWRSRCVAARNQRTGIFTHHQTHRATATKSEICYPTFALYGQRGEPSVKCM